ncbi:nucleoside triphosphate pyrophosphohydrolase [Paraglaciecola aquimarina]|uniref:Nucleoside triphosphate pyrophosphohydrolase n=1 Tax=Paraglaciecola aquimarina TaxID=1235557 RepID=A0ABU3SVZ3_9ALTE|nr:nucleoside triphosphate pyrophosphohydrolase [Paraglaciecola aquimarina]MDU0354170.1 nucleoside triphosphate pyrophosphohydrolase [Paraglaciecola aquimarina]
MAQAQLDKLLDIMRQLRDPETGCPWDKEQSFSSIVPYTIEETYEVAEAIFNGNMAEIKDELGDLLFQVVFYAQLGSEQGDFDFTDIVQALSEKLVRRHPHVFCNVPARESVDLSQQWEQIKSQERRAKGIGRDNSILANVSQGLSPLLRAEKLQKKCATVGFDWSEFPPVVDKIHEEIEEVLVEVNAENVDQQAVEEEVGDLMFSVVNLARFCNVNPESALIKANSKFEKRFRKVEALLKEQGSNLEESSLEQMEAAWGQIKKQ